MSSGDTASLFTVSLSQSPDDTGPIDSLLNCILDTKAWMSQNFLQLNQEVLIVGPKAQREKLASKLNIPGLNPIQEARNLGVIFDYDFNFLKIFPK